jgi:hypothetical protein
VRHGRRAAIAAALAIAAITVVTAGCGGGSASSSSSALKLDPVAAAATKTQNAGPVRIHFAMGIGGSQLGSKTVRMLGTGAVDGHSAELSFGLGSLIGAMGLPQGSKNATAAQLMHARIKEIILNENGDYVIYMQIPFLSSQLPGGKAWMKLDLSKLGKMHGVDMSKLFSGSQFEPTDTLSMLEAEGANVQKAGPATIDGVATTKYRAQIDVAKALQAKGLTSPMFKGMADKMKTITAYVWVDNGGLVRRVQVAYRLPGVAHLAMTMDYYDYGANVTIAAPPSSQVFDATQFAQQGYAGNH